MEHLSQKFIRLSNVRNGQLFVFGYPGDWLLRYRRLNASRGLVNCIDLSSGQIVHFWCSSLVRRVIEAE